VGLRLGIRSRRLEAELLDIGEKIAFVRGWIVTFYLSID
jgi:hypothetical protein